LGSIHRRAGGVRARPLQALDDAYADRIEDCHHHNRDCFGRCSGGLGRRNVGRKDHIDFTIDQVGHYAVIFRVQDGFAVFDADVLSLDIAQFRQRLLEDFKPFRIGILGGYIAHDR
jgi:hypothetical protein